MKKFWLSCNKFTVKIVTDDNYKIIDAAPIVKKFVGRHASNLRKWMEKLGHFNGIKL